jgi:transposase-like protein
VSAIIFCGKIEIKEMKRMGRPKGGTNKSHSKEEKLALVLRNLAGETAADLQRETGIYHTQIHKWTRQYLEGGEEALVNKRKPGNPLAKYERKKNLTPMEQLEYKVAKLERELLKKDAEIVRLKKLNEQERGDARRK